MSRDSGRGSGRVWDVLVPLHTPSSRLAPLNLRFWGSVHAFGSGHGCWASVNGVALPWAVWKCVLEWEMGSGPFISNGFRLS